MKHFGKGYETLCEDCWSKWSEGLCDACHNKTLNKDGTDNDTRD